MGLRFYRNPDEVDAENAAAKLDRAAAQRRSAIRREPSIRPGRDQSSSAGLTNIIRTRHELSTRRAHVRAQYDRQEADAQIEILEAELERLRRLRHRTSQRLSEERSRRRLERQIESDLNSEADSPITTDVYLTTSEYEPSNSQILLPRPTRESNLRFEVAANSSTRPVSPQPPASFMPSPPHSVNDTNGGRPVDGPLEIWTNTPPLTQDFAPAHAPHSPDSEPTNTTGANPDGSRMPHESDRPGLETPPPDTWENTYPPLRRVPHMSPRPLPRNTVDGLGDRHRSPSPSSELHEEETWNNLLTTMDNSNQAPSASTSFASVTDLLTASRTASHRSLNAQNMSASFGEIGTSADDTCDLPPGITEDDVRQIRERHRQLAGRVHVPRRYMLDTRSGRDATADESPASLGAPDSPLSILIDEAREARISRDRQRRRDELLMLHAIAERQQSQDADIPDEWWAMAGLPPSIARSRNDS